MRTTEAFTEVGTKKKTILTLGEEISLAEGRTFIGSNLGGKIKDKLRIHNETKMPTAIKRKRFETAVII